MLVVNPWSNFPSFFFLPDFRAPKCLLSLTYGTTILQVNRFQNLRSIIGSVFLVSLPTSDSLMLPLKAFFQPPAPLLQLVSLLPRVLFPLSWTSNWPLTVTLAFNQISSFLASRSFSVLSDHPLLEKALMNSSHSGIKCMNFMNYMNKR